MDSIKDSPITEKRVGKFSLSYEMIRDTPYEKIMAFMSNFLIVRAEYLFVSQNTEYIAYSALFGVIDEGETIPSYYTSRGVDGSLSIRRGE